MKNAKYFGSQLHEMEKTFNTIFTGVMQFDFSLAKAKAAEVAAAKLKENPSYDKPVGLFAKSLLDSSAGSEPYKTSSFAGLWTTEKYGPVLKQHWETVSDFMFQIAVATKSYRKEVNKSSVEESEKASGATKAIIDTRERKTVSVPLYSNWGSIDEEVTEPDMNFLYNRLRKDKSGNLYFLFDGGELLLIPLQDASHGRRIADDGDFWTLFIKYDSKKIKEYCRRMIEIAYELQSEGTFDSSEKTDTLEQRLESVVPHCISRQVSMQLIFIKDGRGKNASWLFDSFSLAMTGMKPSMNKDNWCAVLQQDMLRFLNMDLVQPIKQWSNNIIGGQPKETSIHSIDTSYIELGRKVTSIPKLPPHFAQFFNGKFVNPIMDLLRIAVFILSIIDEDNHSRQSLLVVGLGKDGKGVWTKVVEYIVGKAFVTLQETAFDVNNKFGLTPALNKRVICMQDVKYPTQVIESPMFKSITGCDTVVIDRKFLDPVTWKVDGTKVMIVTNKPVWLNNEYAITRVLPVFFKQNYDPMDVLDVTDITTDLCSEAKDFVQWCYDYVEYFKQLKNSKDEPFRFITANGLIILSDDQFRMWKNGELEATHKGFWKEVQKDAFEAESVSSIGQTMFKVSQFESANESLEEFFQLIFDKMFVLDPTSKVKRTDVVLAITAKAESIHNPVPELNAIGIGRSLNSERIRKTEDFLTWLAMRPGVEKIHPQNTVYFKGLRLAENTNFDLNTVYRQKVEDVGADII